MKNSLGKIFIFIITFNFLYAEDFSYNFHIDNQTPYVKESILLTLELNQTNRDIVLLFNFNIKKSDSYSFTRVNTEETDTHHNAKVNYTYLLYPLKSGDIEIEFELLKKVTSDDSVAYSFSGDRDNIKGLVTTDTPITLPPLQLRVKALPKDTLLIGDFRLTHSIKKHNAKAYEPLPFQVTIEGLGYPPQIDSILPKEGEFRRFIEKPQIDSKATTKGTENRATYSMALSHKESFNLDTIKLKAFNPKTKKSYNLTIPTQRFEIEKVNIEKLIDKSNSPAILEYDWSWLKTLLGYLVVFVAGYLTALSLKWKKKDKNIDKRIDPLRVKIERCQDEKALLKLLLATDIRQFASSIEKLETNLYRKGKMSFNKLKKEVLNASYR